MTDPINPDHYKSTPPGIGLECIEYTRHLGFCLGNAAKYIYRAGSKGDLRQDLEKAHWYLHDVLDHGYTDVLGEDLLTTIDPDLSPRSTLFYLIVIGDDVAALDEIDGLLRLDLDRFDLDEENHA